MDRRTLLLSGLVSLGAASLAQARVSPTPPPADETSAPPSTEPRSATAPTYSSNAPGETFSRDEVVNKVSDFLGVTAESAGAMVEKLFAQNGAPTGYIAGEEGSGALAVGLRYGRGLLYMKDREPVEVFWQGPSIGWDVGGNASRVFTLCYNLQVADAIYQRFPGVEGTAYFIGGLGVNYQRASDITLAPIRAGVGFRLGANAGYLAYTRKRNIIPF